MRHAVLAVVTLAAIIGSAAGLYQLPWSPTLGVARAKEVSASPSSTNPTTGRTPATNLTLVPSTQTAAELDPILARGLSLYSANCAACHGEAGLGDGRAAYLLYPKPRNFSQGAFRITSTKSGMPSDQDLLQVLRRGMPGSAMPAWSHLPESDLNALVRAVRHLAVQGKAAQIIAASSSTSREKAIKTATSLLQPGAPIELPEKPQYVDLARGKEIYGTNCAACHGADGRGRDKRDLKDDNGFPIFARDFTQGIFKGGSSERDIALRIKRGMPGSPMPSGNAEGKDFWDLVGYVRSLAKEGTQARVEQQQQTLTASRTRGAIDIDPASPLWREAPSTFLPVMPLWWRDDRIEGVEVRALHDGSRVAIHLSWRDATCDETALAPQQFGDGAAIQVSRAANPPLFAMGDRQGEVVIWHWKATWQRDVTRGAPELRDRYTNLAPHTEDVTSETTFDTAAAAGNPVASKHDSPIENLSARGFGTLTNRGPGAQNVRGGARWADGTWQVVFVRDLKTKDGDIALDGNDPISIGFAVWDGSAGDRNGQKSVTIWHRLVIDGSK